MSGVTVTPRNARVTPQVLPIFSRVGRYISIFLYKSNTIYRLCTDTCARTPAHTRAHMVEPHTQILGVTALQAVWHGKNRRSGPCYRVTTRPARQKPTIFTRKKALPRPLEAR